MMQMLSTLLILSSLASLVHSARYSLMRIAESKDRSALEQVADFSSIFEENDLPEKYRDLLLSENIAFSLSMSLATTFPEESLTPATPTLIPAPNPSPIAPPTSLPVSSLSPDFSTTTNATISAAGEQEDDAVNLSTAGSKSPNIALIVIGSCALVGLAAFAAKKFQSHHDDSPLYGTVVKGVSSEISSIKTSDNVISTTNSLDSDLMHNIEV